MKKLIFSIFMFVLSFNFSNSQTQKQIHDEAYPQQTQIADNSSYAHLWKQVVDARKSGNDILYKELSKQLKVQFPNKFSSVINNSSPFKVTSTIPPFISSDWINGDILMYAGSISAPTAGNPNPNDRMIKVEADSTGNQYAAFIEGSRDSMMLYKSTNLGQSWFRIASVTISGQKFHSFDMFITDSSNVFKLGFAVSVVTASGTGYDGSLYWASVNADGTGFWFQQIQTTASGRGLIGPAIVSDGYDFTVPNTYWYVTYQDVNASTGAGNLALLSLSTDWGVSWLVDTARSSYNDYELDIDYSWGGDTIYVHLTNNLTVNNENLRLRYSALSNIGTNVSWKQFNTGSTSSPEKAGCITVNRNTNEMIVTYTIVESSNNNISYSYAPNGYSWTTGVALSNGTQSETRSKIECQQRQGVYHASFVSTASGYDTVIYYNSASVASGFINRQVVNVTNNSSSDVAPDVVGFRVSNAVNGGAVGFAGTGNTGVYYDGSETIVGVEPPNKIPAAYFLQQNYPNPFNPSTTIKFGLLKDEFVTLKVYNILGEEISSLISANMKAGSHEFVFDASNLSSGLYLYKINAGSFSEVKKMILVK